jgi:hypothetical protein
VQVKTLPAMTTSRYVMLVVPETTPDVKFCVELGLAIMLEKLIIAVLRPGQELPRGLRQVTWRTVRADPRTPEGKTRLAKILAELHEDNLPGCDR